MSDNCWDGKVEAFQWANAPVTIFTNVEIREKQSKRSVFYIGLKGINDQSVKKFREHIVPKIVELMNMVSNRTEDSVPESPQTASKEPLAASVDNGDMMAPKRRGNPAWYKGMPKVEGSGRKPDGS